MYATLDELLHRFPGARYVVKTDDGWLAAHNSLTAIILADGDLSRIFDRT